MNYLAHAYLSFDLPEILVGNMISDFVKGKKKLEFSKGIQKGIDHHRAIDEFTDNHPITKEAKQFFRPAYGLYAGAFMDIVYDHFLAKDQKQFPSSGDLAAFAARTYTQLIPFSGSFPQKFLRMFHYMQEQNWLFNYQFKKNIHYSFEGLVRRASFIDEHDSAITVFEETYSRLGQYYESFFPALKNFAFQRLAE